ncbi:hypothetical protein BpHYR1_040441 [Brachionus plicatilis]|uniref:Uncharacterized protein n=1 Tax=Brachionus plicatilis TaxID=10195 RepID=A0A3M7QXE3_BRAPC|nr:hypothetical protein BpHYR1_040441 [Brachionus plicatilis]
MYNKLHFAYTAKTNFIELIIIGNLQILYLLEKIKKINPKKCQLVLPKNILDHFIQFMNILSYIEELRVQEPEESTENSIEIQDNFEPVTSQTKKRRKPAVANSISKIQYKRIEQSFKINSVNTEWSEWLMQHLKLHQLSKSANDVHIKIYFLLNLQTFIADATLKRSLLSKLLVICIVCVK